MHQKCIFLRNSFRTKWPTECGSGTIFPTNTVVFACNQTYSQLKFVKLTKDTTLCSCNDTKLVWFVQVICVFNAAIMTYNFSVSWAMIHAMGLHRYYFITKKNPSTFAVSASLGFYRSPLDRNE